jgi:integrase
MPRKKPPHVDHYIDCRGRHRWAFRIGHGPRTPLPPLGTPEFDAAYVAALAGRLKLQPEERPPSGGHDTIAGLVSSYIKSAAFRDLRRTTKPGYLSRLEMLRVEHGHRSVSGMTRERIENVILAPLDDRPGAKIDTLKKLRILIKHAIAIGWLNHDPSLGIKRPRNAEIRSWTDAEIETFRARWPISSKQRLAFEIMLTTGLRRSDAHRLTWRDVNGDIIRVTTQKTGAKVAIKAHRDLLEVLAVADRRHITIIVTEYGRPFTVDGFSDWMRDAIAAAGLPLDCQPHGLRKAAGRRLAEAGCTTREIMAVLGHKSLAEAERYTRDADHEQLAAGAITKLEGGDARTKREQTPLTVSAAVPNTVKSNGKSA